MKPSAKINRQLLVTRTPEETRQAGMALGRSLQGKEVVLLRGNLGGGKTTFAQGLLAGLGVTDGVLSPTFILAQSFAGKRGKKKVHIHHLDFYRLSKNGILGMGIQDYLMGSGDIPRGVVVIEWPERLKEVWPRERVEVTFKLGKKSSERRIQLNFIGVKNG